MRFTNKFPYTNINNINLDWIIKRVKELGETVRSYANDIANAVALANTAQEAADSVTGTAESAVATAQAAEATANAIAGTANSALSTAQAANTTAQAAEATANAIAGTANSALSTAQAANATAQAANATAQAAEESADNAESIAGTASANASNAVQTANTALATAQTALTIASQFDESGLNEKAGLLVDTLTGAITSFVPDSTIENLLGVTVAVEPMQAGSGDPSPDNVRPISDRNSVEINVTGKNLIDTSNATSGLCGYRAGDTLDTVVASTRYSHSVQIPARGGLKLSYRSNDVSTFNQCLIECFTGRNWASAITGDSVSDTSTVRVLTVPANTYDWVKVMYSAPSGGIVGTDVDGDIQLETGSSATAFKPYTGTTYTIALGQTVYGGTLDATAGTMTVDMAMVDLGSLNWSYSSIQNVMYTSGISSSVKRPATASEIPNIYCSALKPTASSGVAGSAAAIGIHTNGNVRAWYTDCPTTGEAFKTAVAGWTLVYPLATPIEITLDPVTIAAISGQTNNVWADAGEVSVKYAADLKWYIDSKIAEVQALALENGG